MILPGKHRALVLAIDHDRRNEMLTIYKAVEALWLLRPKRNLTHLYKRPDASLFSFLGRLDQGTKSSRIGKLCQGLAFGLKDHRRDSNGFCEAIPDRLEFIDVDQFTRATTMASRSSRPLFMDMPCTGIRLLTAPCL